MLKLPNELRKYGYQLKLVRRCENKAVYAQYYKTHLIGYEIIKIHVRPPRFNKILNKNQPEREVYPSSEQWGKSAWSSSDLSRAIERYNLI